MDPLTKTLTRQATRTVTNKAIRSTAKTLDLPPIVKHVGLAAVIAAVSYIISKKMK